MAGNEYLSFLEDQDLQRQQGEAARLAGVSTLTYGLNPDEVAKSRKVAGFLGVPPAAVEATPDEFARQAQVKKIDLDTQATPALRRKYTDADFHKLASDDSGVLSGIESAIRGFFARPEPDLYSREAFAEALASGRAGRGRIGETWRRPAGSMRGEERSFTGAFSEPVRRGLEQGDRGLTLLLGQMGLLRGSDVAVRMAEQQRRIERFPVPPATQEGMEQISGAQTMGEAASAALRNPRAVFEVSLQSLGASTPALVGAVAGSTMGPAGTATGAGLGSFAVEYAATLQDVMAEAGVNGRDPGAITTALQNQELMAAAREKALKRGVPIAIFDALTAGIAGRILAGAKPTAVSLGTRMAGEAAVQAGGGAAGEATAQAVTGEYKPGDILLEALAEMPSALVEAPANVRHARQQIQQAEASSAAIQQLMDLSAASKARERDTATFRGFMQEATEDGPLERLYVSPRELQQAGVDLAQLAEITPSIAQDLAQAAETGVDVAILTAELATTLPGSVLEQSLLPHLKTEPEGFSQAGAAAYMETEGETVRQAVEKVLAEKGQDEQFREGMRQVEANVLAQLKAANRFTEDVNAPYAALWSNFFAVQAAQVGVTPQELFAKYAPKIVAQTPAGALLDQFVPLGQNGRVPADPNAPGQAGAAQGADSGKSSTKFTEDNRLSNLSWTGPSWTRIREQNPALAAANNADDEVTIYRATIGDEIRPDDFVAVDERVARAELKNVKARDKAGKIISQKVRVRDLLMGNDATEFVYFPANESTAPDSGGALQQADAQVTRGSFNPQTNTLALLQAADLSTFLHESGHFFLEVLGDLAAQPDAPQQIKDDFDAFLKWTGVDSAEAWRAMTLEQQRAHHEDFARGFEAYLFGGKAPSIELQGLFQRFRAWLLNVYRSIASLDVNLTPEIRQVFDRMLATTEQIKLAEDVRGFDALFKNKPEGMTADEWAVYQIQANDATQQAISELEARSLRDMKWLANAKSRELRRLQKEAKAARDAIGAEVRAEVEAQPVYRALSAIREIRKSDPAERAAVKAWTEQRDAERARLAEVVKGQYLDTPEGKATKGIERGQFLARNKRAMANEVERVMLQWEQANPRPKLTIPDADLEQIAALHGFTSGDHLRKEMDAAQPIKDVIEGMTDQRMLESHADLVDERSIEAAAERAIHNDARLKFTATELNALRKATGQPALLASAVRQFAADIIARAKVRDLRPSVYTAAEKRAALDAAKAAAAGKLEEAAIQKRNQLINGHAAKAAMQAQDEAVKIVEYFRRFDSRSKTIDAGYQDQIEALLERFDFRQASLKEIDRRKSLAEWYAEQLETGHAPNIPQELLDEANRKHFKNLTMEELRGLRDTVKQIEHIGRLKNKLLLARDQREFDAIATEMAQSIVDHGGKPRPVDLETPTGFAPWMQGLAAMHRKLASLFRQMDGNRDQGPMYEHIGRGMNERGTMEDVAIEKATRALQKIYAPVVALPGGVSGWRSKVFIPEIGTSLTRGGRLAVALNWGNEANRQRILDGDRWTEGQVRAILATLSPTELQFVNDAWAYLDSYWPEIAAKEKRLTGVEPEKVEAVPFTATAADGTTVKMRGGYYPIKYDANRSDRAEQHEAVQAAKEMMQGAFTRATTRRGHTKERLAEVNRAVRKDLNVITQHVTQVVHDLAWHEWLIDTNKLLGDRRIVSAIRDHYGPATLKTIRDDVMGIATADVAPQTDIDTALLLLRSNVSRATMGASLTTAFLQPFGLAQSMVRIGPRHVLAGAARWAGDAARLENTLGWIRGKSDFMRLRAQTFNKELREIRGSVAGKSVTMKTLDASLFFLMQKMQMVADVPTWIGQYQKSLAEGLDDAAAVAMADRAVLESQGGGATKDLAEVQRKHPMLTQFYSYFNTTLNLTVEQTAATDFRNPRAVAGWLGDMALLLVIPAILPALIVHLARGGDDDGEEWAKRIAEWQVSYLMGLVAGLREFSGAVAGFDYAGPPVGRIVTDIGKAGQQTAQGELDEPAVMAYVRLLGSAFGVPTVQAIRSYRGWVAWDKGDAPASAILFGPPPRD